MSYLSVGTTLVCIGDSVTIPSILWPEARSDPVGSVTENQGMGDHVMREAG